MAIRFHITVSSEDERGEVKKLLDQNDISYTITGLSYKAKKDTEELKAEEKYHRLSRTRFKLDDYEAEMVKGKKMTRLEAIKKRISMFEGALGKARGV
jgi:signal recognition particle GTPase